MGFSPIRNPIFEREFSLISRTRRWFVLRACLAATLVLFLLLALAFSDLPTGDDLGRMLFGVLAFVELAGVAAVTPALVVDAVVAERSHRTLDLLLATPLRPLGILFGKLSARVLLVVVLSAATFPLLAVPLLYGGVEGEQLFDLFLVVVGVILFLAGVALFLSTCARRLGTAAVLAYLLPLAYCGAVPVLLYVAQDGNHMESADTLRSLARIHPVVAAVAVVEHSAFRSFRRDPVPPWFYWLFVGAATALAGLALSVLRLRREHHAVSARGRRSQIASGPGPPPTPASASSPAASHAPRIARPRRGLFGDLRRPMLWKEANLVNSTHSRVLFWIVLALLLLGEGLFALTVASNRGHAERDPIAHLTLVTIEAGILLILVAVNAAVCVVTEREQGTLDLVHATLITPGEIVAAKIAGTLRSVAFLLAIPFLHLLLAHVVADVPGRAILAYFAILTVFLFLFTVTGVRFSVISKRPGRAVVRSIGLLGILVVGVPVVLGLLAAISGRGEDALLTLLASNPMSLIFYPAACMVRHGVSEPQYTTATGFWAIAYPIAAVALAASLPGTYARRRKALEGGPA